MLYNIPIVRISKKGTDKAKTQDDTVAAEYNLTIHLDNEELVTLHCSPDKLDYLAAGFLFSEGLIKEKEDLKEIVLDEKKGLIEITTEGRARLPHDTVSRRSIGSSGGRGISLHAVDQRTIESKRTISPSEIFILMEKFLRQSKVYAATGGVHSAALCDTRRILLFSEDIGRHNAIDKVFGECLLKALPTDDHIVITSGRVSSEIVNKIARGSIPIVISKSAPTNRGIELAADLGITLVGFVREGRMNLYTHTRRVVYDGL
jgi:FdhD protein